MGDRGVGITMQDTLACPIYKSQGRQDTRYTIQDAGSLPYRQACILDHVSKSINKKKAQATIEVTLAFICFFLLLFGTLKIFIWMNERMVRRQQDYEATRVEAGSIGDGDPGVYVDESDYPRLDIFGEM